MTRWRFEEADPDDGWPYPDDEDVDVEAEAAAVEVADPPAPQDRFIVRQAPDCQAFGHTQDRAGFGACPSCGGDWPW